MFSISNLLAIVVGISLIKFFSGSYLVWVGWAILVVGSTYHLATVPLKVVNAGPNHGKYNS